MMMIKSHSAVEDQYRRLAGSLQDLQARLDTALTNQTQVRLTIHDLQDTVAILDSSLQVATNTSLYDWSPRVKYSNIFL